MRIVFVLPDLPLSGAATRTVHLAEKLIARGDAALVVTLRDVVDRGLEDRLGDSGVTVVRLTTLRAWRAIRTWTARESVVVHAAMPTAGAAGLCLARLANRPLVYSYTNCPHELRPFREWSARDEAKSSLEWLLARRSDALHAVSDGVARQLESMYPIAAGRVRSIPYYVGSPALGRSERPLAGDGAPRLLCVARLVRHKRVDDVLAAVAILRRIHPNLRLIVLGEGPQRVHLDDLATGLGITSNVTFAGESHDPGAYLDWADILVHASTYEGYPRVFAEAIAKGTPIVTVVSPYAREAAASGATVFLARPLDSHALASAIRTALAGPARFDSATAHSDSSSEMLENLVALYGETLARRRRQIRSSTLRK